MNTQNFIKYYGKTAEMQAGSEKLVIKAPFIKRTAHAKYSDDYCSLLVRFDCSDMESWHELYIGTPLQLKAVYQYIFGDVTQFCRC